jgi:hydrogenase small subunit
MVKAKTQEIPVLWIQCATCSGCSVAVLNSISPTAKNILIDELVPGKHLNLKFQATIMAGAGEPVIKVLENTQKVLSKKYVLVVEGSIPTKDDGAYGSIGETNGKPVTMVERVRELGTNALAVIALGTCAAYGGIPKAGPNPTGIMGVGEFLEKENIDTPCVNIPGCPPHPDWFVHTVASIILFGLPSADQLDCVGRPKAFYGKLIHDNCPRRGFYNIGRFAKHFNDPGCLYELGCKGPFTYADCPLRHFNNGVNWCIDHGSPCHGCVEPGFPDRRSGLYAKIWADKVKLDITKKED